MQLAHAIAELGGTFRFLEVDDAFCNLLRTSRKNIFDKAILDVTHHADRPRNKRLLHDLVEVGASFTIRKRYRRGDGTLVRVENHVARIFPANGEGRLIASVKLIGEYGIKDMIEDATAKAQALREETSALKTMLAGRS